MAHTAPTVSSIGTDGGVHAQPSCSTHASPAPAGPVHRAARRQFAGTGPVGHRRPRPHGARLDHLRPRGRAGDPGRERERRRIPHRLRARARPFLADGFQPSRRQRRGGRTGRRAGARQRHSDPHPRPAPRRRGDVGRAVGLDPRLAQSLRRRRELLAGEQSAAARVRGAGADPRAGLVAGRFAGDRQGAGVPAVVRPRYRFHPSRGRLPAGRHSWWIQRRRAVLRGHPSLAGRGRPRVDPRLPARGRRDPGRRREGLDGRITAADRSRSRGARAALARQTAGQSADREGPAAQRGHGRQQLVAGVGFAHRVRAAVDRQRPAPRARHAVDLPGSAHHRRHHRQHPRRIAAGHAGRRPGLHAALLLGLDGQPDGRDRHLRRNLRGQHLRLADAHGLPGTHRTGRHGVPVVPRQPARRRGRQPRARQLDRLPQRRHHRHRPPAQQRPGGLDHRQHRAVGAVHGLGPDLRTGIVPSHRARAESRTVPGRADAVRFRLAELRVCRRRRQHRLLHFGRDAHSRRPAEPQQRRRQPAVPGSRRLRRAAQRVAAGGQSPAQPGGALRDPRRQRDAVRDQPGQRLHRQLQQRPDRDHAGQQPAEPGTPAWWSLLSEPGLFIAAAGPHRPPDPSPAGRRRPGQPGRHARLAGQQLAARRGNPAAVPAHRGQQRRGGRRVAGAAYAGDRSDGDRRDRAPAGVGLLHAHRHRAGIRPGR